MTQMAAGPDSMDVEDWMPSKIYLSVPLMWEILQFSFTEDPQNVPTAGLLDSSLTPAIPQGDPDGNSTLEIIVATSPEITINTADGGQEAPTSTLSYKGPQVPSSSYNSTRGSPWNSNSNNNNNNNNSNRGGGGGGDEPMKYGEQTDFLSFNFTPWLYADSAQFMSMEDMGYDGSQSSMSENRGMAWWEGENYSNILFNHF